MSKFSIVVDTNVIYSGLRSDLGASFKLIQLFGTQYFQLNVSIPLILEYEEVLTRSVDSLAISTDDIGDFLDFISLISSHHEIHYLWRPTLRDPNDEMLLELAVKAQSDYIITYNKKDFKGIDQFGIKLLTPSEFLSLLGL